MNSILNILYKPVHIFAAFCFLLSILALKKLFSFGSYLLVCMNLTLQDLLFFPPKGPLLLPCYYAITIFICLFAMAALLWMLAFKYEYYEF